jgi:hypothetical protein
MEDSSGFLNINTTNIPKLNNNEEKFVAPKSGEKLTESALYACAKKYCAEGDEILSKINQKYLKAGFFIQANESEDYHVLIHPSLSHESNVGIVTATNRWGKQNNSPSLTYMNDKVFNYLKEQNIAEDKCHFHYLISQEHYGIHGNHYVYAYRHGSSKTLHVVDSKHKGLYRPEQIKKILDVTQVQTVATGKQGMLDDWSCGWHSLDAFKFLYQAINNKTIIEYSDDNIHHTLRSLISSKRLSTLQTFFVVVFILGTGAGGTYFLNNMSHSLSNRIIGYSFISISILSIVFLLYHSLKNYAPAKIDIDQDNVLSSPASTAHNH